MADKLTSEQRHLCMSKVRSKNTIPEIFLRKELWRKGFRFRLNVKDLPGSPDIVLPKYRTAIFVHGCFWHGHQGCKYYTVPKSNTEFWMAKIARNQERDQEVWRQLEAKGWNVIIVWECELKKTVLEDTLKRVSAEIVRNGEEYLAAQNDRKRSREVYKREQRERKERLFIFTETIF